MPRFRVFKTAQFDSDYSGLDKREKGRVEKILKQLVEKGDQVGKPLSGLGFFREKKFGSKRLYYLVYEEVLIILALAISDKKAQPVTINKILLNLAEYQRYVFETLRKKELI